MADANEVLHPVQQIIGLFERIYPDLVMPATLLLLAASICATELADNFVVLIRGNEHPFFDTPVCCTNLPSRIHVAVASPLEKGVSLEVMATSDVPM